MNPLFPPQRLEPMISRAKTERVSRYAIGLRSTQKPNAGLSPPLRRSRAAGRAGRRLRPRSTGGTSSPPPPFGPRSKALCECDCALCFGVGRIGPILLSHAKCAWAGAPKVGGRGEAANPFEEKCASSLPLRLYTRYKGLWSPRYSRDAAQFLLSKRYRLYAKVHPSPPRVADDGTAFSRAAPPARPEEAPSRMSPLPGRGLRLGFVGLALQSASAHTAAARFLPALPSHEQPTDGSDRAVRCNLLAGYQRVGELACSSRSPGARGRRARCGKRHKLAM